MWNTQETCSVIFCNGCVVNDSMYTWNCTPLKKFCYAPVISGKKSDWTNKWTSERASEYLTLLHKISFILCTDYKVLCLHNYHLFHVHALILLPINSSSLSMNCVATVRTDTHQSNERKGRTARIQRVSKETIVTNRLKGGRTKWQSFFVISLICDTSFSLTTKKYSRD